MNNCRERFGRESKGLLFGGSLAAVWVFVLPWGVASYARHEASAVLTAFWALGGASFVVYGVRNLSVRVTASTEGVEIVNMFSHRTVAWSAVDRFELRPHDWAASMVLAGGKRVELHALSITAFYSFRERAPIRSVVEQLNELLRNRTSR